MNNEEKIDRYFSGEMDDLERRQFDEEVMNDPKFAKAVKSHKDMVLGVKTFGLQHQVQSIMAEHQSQHLSRQARPKIRWWHGLLLAGVLALAYWLYQSTKAPMDANEQFYLAYYYADPGLPTTMGTVSEPTFSDGMIEYKNQNYGDALKIWSGLSANNDDKTIYFSALCLHELNQNEDSLNNLRKINASSSYFQKALWYRSLIKLKLGDRETAVNNLTQLSKLPDSIYSQRAHELLKKLNNR